MKSQKPEFFLPKNMTPASVLDRMAAQLLDLILLILGSFAISVFFGMSGLWISWLGFCVYFGVCHFFWGQTLGKKIIGIRLISVDAQSLNLWRLLLRETVGRMICTVSLFLGYLRILVFKDRRGVHDLISKSAVISETSYQTSWAHFSAIAFTVFATFSFSTYILFFKTTFIAKAVLTVLQAQGVQVSSLSGNMSQGWRIENFSGGTQKIRYQFKGIHIKHSPAGFYSAGTWHAQEIHVDEMDIQLSPQLLNFSYFQGPSKNVSFQAPSIQELQLASYPIKGFVDQLQVGQLRVTDGKDLQMVFHKIQAKQMNYADGWVRLNDIKTSPESSAQVELSQFVFHPLTQNLQLKMKLFAKKEMHKALRRDLDLSLQWNGSVSTPERFKVVAFENHFQVSYDKGHLNVVTSDWTPARYLQASPLFKNISAKLKHVNCQSPACLKDLKGQGSFVVQNRKVEFKNDKVWLTGLQDEVVGFHYSHLTEALFEKKPVLKVISEESLQDFIARFYYDKPALQLTPAEQSVVQQDHVYFKVMKERFDPNKPKHIDTFLHRSPSELSESR